MHPMIQKEPILNKKYENTNLSDLKDILSLNRTSFLTGLYEYKE